MADLKLTPEMIAAVTRMAERKVQQPNVCA